MTNTAAVDHNVILRENIANNASLARQIKKCIILCIVPFGTPHRQIANEFDNPLHHFSVDITICDNVDDLGIAIQITKPPCLMQVCVYVLQYRG